MRCARNEARYGVIEKYFKSHYTAEFCATDLVPSLETRDRRFQFIDVSARNFTAWNAQPPTDTAAAESFLRRDLFLY